jgi:hypothetical protein
MIIVIAKCNITDEGATGIIRPRSVLSDQLSYLWYAGNGVALPVF